MISGNVTSGAYSFIVHAYQLYAQIHGLVVPVGKLISISLEARSILWTRSCSAAASNMSRSDMTPLISPVEGFVSGTHPILFLARTSITVVTELDSGRVIARFGRRSDTFPSKRNLLKAGLARCRLLFGI